MAWRSPARCPLFDLRGFIPADPAEGQIAEGGQNARANCVPSAHLYCLKCLGLGDPLEPQDITSILFPGGLAPQGMTFEAVVGAIQSRAGDYGGQLPPMPVTAPADLFSALEDAGISGFPVCVALAVNDATVTPVPAGSPSSSGHCEIVVADTPGGWVLWNPWSGGYDVVSDSLLAESYLGGITVFEWSLEVLNVINQTDFEALIWRVEALTNNRATIAGGPEAGKPNLLAAKLAEIEGKIQAVGPVAGQHSVTGTLNIS